MEAVEIRRYRTAAGREPFSDWLTDLRDSRACAKVLVRLERLALGNFGDCRSLGHRISELRIDWGPGYRIYFGREGSSLVILLCGGDKGSQSADVRKARALWQEHENRRHAPPAGKH